MDEKIIKRDGHQDKGLETFAKNRNYDVEILKSFGLYSEGDYVCIPVDVDYVIKKPIEKGVGRKSIKPSGQSKPWFIRGEGDKCFIVEGETDAIAAKHILKDANVLSLGGVSNVKFIDQLPDHFTGNKIIICFDNDDAGEKGTKKAIEHIMSNPTFDEFDVRVLKVPKYKKDIDDFYYQYGDNHLMLKLDKINTKSKTTFCDGDFLGYMRTLTDQEISTGKMIRCVNPEHDDKTPSMMVYEHSAYCFSCGHRVALKKKPKSNEMYESDFVVVKGFILQHNEEETKSGDIKKVIKKVPTETKVELRVFDKNVEFFSEGTLINSYAVKGDPTNKEINSIARVLVDVDAFSKPKDARAWIAENKIFKKLRDMKDQLNERISKIKKAELLLPAERRDLVWNFNFDLHNVEDHARAILSSNPLFYTDQKEWLKWNKKEYKWEVVLEHYIIEFAKKAYEAKGLSKSQYRTELLNALKDETASNVPQELKPTEIQIGKKIYDIATGGERMATPKDMSLIIIPHTLNEELKCPTIDRIFKEWLPEKHERLYDIVAFMMSPSYFLDVNFWLVGSGENGKGLFCDVIAEVIGDENIVAQDIELLCDPKDRFTKGFLRNKLMCNLGDGNATSMANTKALKTLSGNKDPIRCEIKGGGQSQFRNQAKLLGAFNSLPETSDKTKGFYRRAYIIEFPKDFAGQKNPLPAIPKEEYTALATKCFTRLKEIYKIQELFGKPKWHETKDLWEYLSNPLKKYIEESMKKDIRGFFTISKIFGRYQKWAHKKGHNEFTFEEFKKKLENLNVGKLRKNVYITDDGFVYGKEEEIPKKYVKCNSLEDLGDKPTYEKAENKLTVYNGFQFFDAYENNDNSRNSRNSQGLGIGKPCVKETNLKSATIPTKTTNPTAWDKNNLAHILCQCGNCRQEPTNLYIKDNKYYCKECFQHKEQEEGE